MPSRGTGTESVVSAHFRSLCVYAVYVFVTFLNV